MSKVDTQHPIYAIQQEKRADYRAVVGGTDTMRATGERLLPRYPGEPSDDYTTRLNGATIDGLVRSGVTMLCGKVFDDEINTDAVAQSLKPYLDNFDNQGTSFNVFARNAFEASFDGFALIIADMPEETEEMRKARKLLGAEADRRFNMRPYARLYEASSVINWSYRTNPMTHTRELALLVLMENSEEMDGFEHTTVTRYRVYRLENGAVRWELYREIKAKGTKESTFELEGTGIVSNVTEIPAALIGSFTDDPKLLVESRLEIRAYQKESSFDVIEYLSIPIFYTIGYPNDAPALTLGASTHLRLPGGLGNEGAAVGYAQLDSSGHESLKGTITHLKDTIKQSTGAIADSTVRVVDKTATESMNEAADRDARLSVWADELKDALERTLQFMGQMIGLGEDNGGEIELMMAWDRMAEAAALANNTVTPPVADE